MKLIHRIGYYLGGFSIGLIILAFFLKGKNTSCAYGPNARTVKNIGLKKKIYTKEAELIMTQNSMDTALVTNLIRTGDVDFSNSTINKDTSCNIYLIENKFNDKNVILSVKNCDSLATILKIDLE